MACNSNLEYGYEQQLLDGTVKTWTLVYEVEVPSRGGRDEPPSGGYATIYEIRHGDGSKLPDDSWAAGGFDQHEIERLETLCYDAWANAQMDGRYEERERKYDERKEGA